MSRLSFSGAIVVALVTLAATAQAGKPGIAQPAGKACSPFRPNKPGAQTRPSFALPKVHRPSVNIRTWGVQTTWQVIRNQTFSPSLIRDPYKAEMTGYNEGSKVTLSLQKKSDKVQIPVACPGCVESAPAGLKNPAKWAKKQRSKAWRKAVGAAVKWEKLETFQINVPSHKQTQAEQRADVLPTHTPYKLSGRDAFNRKYATLSGNVQGLPTSAAQRVTRRQVVGSNTYTQSGSQTNSGLHVPAYDVGGNTNAQNLYITPAYQKGDQVQAKVLGLAAFPAGAKITVTNLRMHGAGEEGHTASFVASKSGSGSIPVAGLQRDKLKVTVSYDGVANQASAASHSFNVRIPTVSGKPAFKSRGIVYYGAALAE